MSSREALEYEIQKRLLHYKDTTADILHTEKLVLMASDGDLCAILELIEKAANKQRLEDAEKLSSSRATA